MSQDLKWFVVLMTVLLPMTEGWALEPTPTYAIIQRAFLQEEFSSVVSLAPTFIMQYPETPEAARVRIWWALSLDRLQQSDEALSQLDALKARLPDDDPLWAEVLFWEGDVSRRARHTIRAKLAYQRLIEHYQTSTWVPQAQTGLGLIYLHQQAFELAIGYFHEVAVRDPTTPIAQDALLFEGFCHLRLGHFQDAATVLAPLMERLEDTNTTAQTAFYLGESWNGLGRYDDATKAYQRAITANPASPWGQAAQFGLGWSAYRANRCEDSVAAFEQYLKDRATAAHASSVGEAEDLGADHQAEAMFAQGNCLLQLGREPEAVSKFKTILAAYPTHPLAFESGLTLSDTYRKEGRLTAAQTLLETFLRQSLDALSHAKVQLRLGTLSLEQGNAVQAKALFELASAHDDTTIRQAALSGLGDVQTFQGDSVAASQSYAQAVQLAETTSVAAYATYQLGRLRLQAGALNEAISFFQRVVSGADATLADDAKLALALTYLSQHEERLARTVLESVRQARPKSILAARAGYYLAVMALGQADEATARRLCEETMAAAPTTEEAIDARLLLAEMLARRKSIRVAMAWLRDGAASSHLPRRHRAKLSRQLGDFARAEGSYAEAIEWYETAAELLPSLGPEATYRIASCLEEGGDIERAMAWYRVIVQPPWRVRGQLAYARLLEREDRTTEAEAVYQQLASEPIPEAKAIQERLAELRGSPPKDTE